MLKEEMVEVTAEDEDEFSLVLEKVPIKASRMRQEMTRVASIHGQNCFLCC